MSDPKSNPSVIAITIVGIELMHRICKGQFALAQLSVQGQVAPAVWETASAGGMN